MTVLRRLRLSAYEHVLVEELAGVHPDMAVVPLCPDAGRGMPLMGSLHLFTGAQVRAQLSLLLTAEQPNDCWWEGWR